VTAGDLCQNKPKIEKWCTEKWFQDASVLWKTMKKAKCEKVGKLHVVFTVETEMKFNTELVLQQKARNFQ